MENDDALASLEERIHRTVELVSTLRNERDAAIADARTLGDHRPAADRDVVTDDHRRGLRRLEHTTDTDTTREVHARPDLSSIVSIFPKRNNKRMACFNHW